MECRLRFSSDAWKCQVSIRWEFDSNGQRLLIREDHFGPPVTNKDDLEIILRRAQSAVLHPEVPADQFHSKSLQDLKALQLQSALPFSRNVVCLDISGPDITDLSFVDLPG